MQGYIRAKRIGWLVVLGLIALFLLLVVVLKEEPFYSMEVASRTQQGIPCSTGYADYCAVQVFLDLTFVLVLPAVLIMLSLLLISIVEAARARRWLRLASLTAPLPLSVALILVDQRYFYDLWRLGIDPNITSGFIIACAAAVPILSLVYTFLPSRQQAVRR